MYLYYTHYRLIRYNMFADRKAHAGACSKRGSDGASDDTVSAHYASSCIKKSSGHFPMIGIVRISPIVLRNSAICDSVQFSFPSRDCITVLPFP